MKKKIIIYSIIAVLVVLAFFGIKKAKKMLALKKAKVNVLDFQLLDNIGVKTLNTGFNTKVDLKLQNYSPNTYQLEQLQVDLYTPSGQLLAEQQQPIKPTEIKPNANTTVSINHYIKSEKFLDLLSENDYIDKKETVLEIAMKLLSMDLSGVNLTIKGFAIIDGLEIPINENISL